MALSSITDALAQYNANLDWHTSQAKAELALQAVRFLVVNRAQRMGDQGTDLNYESLEKTLAVLEKFVGAGAPRALGRSRRLGVSFQEGGVG